jgi:transposase
MLLFTAAAPAALGQAAERRNYMKVVHKRCCGLDVHKRTITACVITPEQKELRTFSTFTGHLLRLADWLKEKKVAHVAMESTGSYWKPVHNILEAHGFEVLLVNARHIKQVPGRKTDVKDAEWIADLMRHGLLTGSFIPDRDQRELRELVRYRRSLIDERTRELNRLEKVLEGANIKLTSVASDISGVSSMAMIQALIDGVEDPKELVQMARGRLRKKSDDLEQALVGLVGPHQKMMLRAQLDHIDFLNSRIAEMDDEVGDRMGPLEEELALLETIPGVGRRSSEAIIAEIGVDMSRFPTDGHLASWAGMSPGNNESAGKRKSGKTAGGNKHLRATLVQCAHAGARCKDTYLNTKYGRVAARRGAKRAAVAVGHDILVASYHMLAKKEPYRELGPNHFVELKRDYAVSSAVQRLQSLGFTVQLEEVVA